MIRIEQDPWTVMVAHAVTSYPRECCGIMLGEEPNPGERKVTLAIPVSNAYAGDQSDRFEIDPRDQLAADKHARSIGLDVLGFFHSHPDHGLYFSKTDLKNSWPWYSNIVISIQKGEFAGAAAFLANEDQTLATDEELIHP